MTKRQRGRRRGGGVLETDKEGDGDVRESLPRFILP